MFVQPSKSYCLTGLQMYQAELIVQRGTNISQNVNRKPTQQLKTSSTFFFQLLTGLRI